MLRNKKIIFLSIASLVFIVLVGIALKVALIKPANPANNPADSKVNLPSFETLKPSGNSSVTLQPLKSDQAFAFDDKIADTAITVSQQPLPKDFAPVPDQSITNLAQKYSATTKITAGNVTAFTGSSAKGDQTTIFTKKGLLVFITSKRSVTVDQLSAYIQSLH